MLDLSRDACNFLSGLQAKHYKQVASKVIDLQREPNPADSKHLAGYPGIKRVDSGEYRICYRVTENIVQIVLIDKRNDAEVYKSMKRKNY